MGENVIRAANLRERYRRRADIVRLGGIKTSAIKEPLGTRFYTRRQKTPYVLQYPMGIWRKRNEQRRRLTDIKGTQSGDPKKGFANHRMEPVTIADRRTKSRSSAFNDDLLTRRTLLAPRKMGWISQAITPSPLSGRP